MLHKVLHKLAQEKDETGRVKFKLLNVRNIYQYNSSDLISACVEGVKANSPDILSVGFHCSVDSVHPLDVNFGWQINLVKADITDFIEALSQNTHLVELTLTGYDFTEEQAFKLAEVLAKNTSILKLGLYQCKFTKDGAYGLKDAIERNQTIKDLSFHETELREQGIEYIAEGLETNQSIVKLTEPIRRHLPGTTNREQKASESIVSSLADNINFEKKRTEYKTMLERIHAFRQQLADLSATSNSSAQQNIDEQRQVIVDKIFALFQEMHWLVGELHGLIRLFKKPGYNSADQLFHQLRYEKADFYLSIEEIESLQALYFDYFIDCTIKDKISIPFRLGSYILGLQPKDKEHVQEELNFLGLHEESLRYQYVIRMLEDEAVRTELKWAWCGLQGKNEQQREPVLVDGLSFEATLGVDRILTNQEFSKLKQYFPDIMLGKPVGIAAFLWAGPIAIGCSQQFSDFLKELKQQLKANELKLLQLRKLLSKSSEEEKDSIKPEEAFAAGIILDILSGKKVTTYAEVRQKNDAAVDCLKLSIVQGGAKNDKDFIKLAFHATNSNSSLVVVRDAVIDKVENQVHLKYLLAQSFKGGVYHKIFAPPSFENVTSEHSRILSASRLAKLSSKYTYEQMVTILQVEYYAFPNSDKASNNDSTSSFFTRYRHRTLEKGLESVFQKLRITPISSDTINEDKKLWTASEILRWIGDQERSFYYKTLKSPELLQSMQTLGDIAHQIIACNDQKTFDKLAIRAGAEINKFSFCKNLGRFFSDTGPKPSSPLSR